MEYNPLEDNWVLWFHSISDNDYSINSYTKVFEFNTIEEYLSLINKINNFGSGMFFFMKEGIEPIWENKENVNGGYWSFKVSKKHINDIWFKLSSQIIGNNFVKDPENNQYINGISLSPKINNCIIKIWLNENQNNKNIFNIDYLENICKDNLFNETKYFKYKNQ